MKCTICGKETRKSRTICKGCHSVKRVAKSGAKTPNDVKISASNHLEENPGLKNIAWSSFFKKNKQTV